MRGGRRSERGWDWLGCHSGGRLCHVTPKRKLTVHGVSRNESERIVHGRLCFPRSCFVSPRGGVEAWGVYVTSEANITPGEGKTRHCARTRWLVSARVRGRRGWGRALGGGWGGERESVLWNPREKRQNKQRERPVPSILKTHPSPDDVPPRGGARHGDGYSLSPTSRSPPSSRNPARTSPSARVQRVSRRAVSSVACVVPSATTYRMR